VVPAAPADGLRDTASIPESVRDRFIQVKEKFFFDNGDLAFRDLGSKLTTKSENAEIVRTFVDIAQARGWEEITVVEGTKAFRRAVWHESSLQNIAVRGYAPTAMDEARLVQTMARRREAERHAEPEAASAPQSPVESHEAHSHRRADRRRDAASPDEAPNAGTASDKRKRVFYGTLLAHGPENFQFNSQEDISYYVKLRTDRGKEMYLWGKDLERALRESKSQPKVGDRVGLSHVGQEPVTVPKKERDGQGRVLREYEIKTHRNEWTIESAEFFRERVRLADVVRDSSIDAKRAVGQSPALAGTYVALKGAELYAKQNFSDTHEQNRFVDAIRRSLARDIRRGAPLHTPALRNREAAREQPTARAPSTPEISPVR
jgi:hypothetical protein